MSTASHREVHRVRFVAKGADLLFVRMIVCRLPDPVGGGQKIFDISLGDLHHHQIRVEFLQQIHTEGNRALLLHLGKGGR